MKEETMYEIGEKLGITQTEIKATLKRNRYKIIARALVVVVSFLAGNYYFLGMHYIGVSIKDFDLFMRFF
jgi:hypothetical protein